MWRLRVLGDIALYRMSGEARRLSANKYAFLLAYLCIRPERAFTREELVDALWPDADLDQGRTCLRAALYALRRQLDEPALFLDGGRELVRINQDVIVTDVGEFEAAVRSKRPDARNLYGGEFLPGCYDDWAVLERCRLDVLFEEASRYPAVPPAEAVFSSLPNPASRFCGRVEEVEQAIDIVRCGRLVSLVGLGGVGKTRLAIQVGKAFEAQRRVVFLPLAKIKKSVEMEGLAADAIGLPKSPTDTLERRIAVELAARPTLLILDNFEHLLRDRGASDWLERLLHKVEEMHCLVTSRIPLDMEGERLIYVEPLCLDDAREMFVDRARGVQPRFAASDELDKLCLRLDGLPLAIAICAARANVLTPRQMLAAFAQRPDSPESLTAPTRLRAVLEWTCPPHESLHDSLAALTVFAGNWTFEAANAILGPKALDNLAALRQRSLIRVEPSSDGNRFSMLDAVRDYAIDTGNGDIVQGARHAHAVYFCDLAQNLAELHRNDEWAAFRGLDAARSNIFAAFEHGLRDPELRPATLRSISLSRWALWVRGYGKMLLRAFEVAEALLAEEERLKDITGAVRAGLYRLAADAAGHRNEFMLALSRLNVATAESLAIGDRLAAADAQQKAGDYCVSARDWEGAIAHFGRQIEIIPSEDLPCRNIARASLANAYLQMQDYNSAIDLYVRLKAFWETQPDSEGHLAMISRGHAHCLARQARPREAAAMLEESVRTFRAMGLVHWETLAWNELAHLYSVVGERTKREAAQAEHAKLFARA